MRVRLVALAGVFAAQCILHAQDTRAKILGTVMDPAGASVAQASVSAVNTATGVALNTKTNEAGVFEILYLLPGAYSVSVEAPGFKKLVRSDIELRIADRVSLDLRLEVGAISEAVTVSAGTPLLEVASASTGAVVDHRRITELPVSGGNALTLERLTPGVVNFAIANHPYELSSAFVASRISVSGMRSRKPQIADSIQKGDPARKKGY